MHKWNGQFKDVIQLLTVLVNALTLNNRKL